MLYIYIDIFLSTYNTCIFLVLHIFVYVYTSIYHCITNCTCIYSIYIYVYCIYIYINMLYTHTHTLYHAYVTIPVVALDEAYVGSSRV